MSAAGLGLLSRSATRVVARAANGFHLLRIDGYSQVKTAVLPGQMISSQRFDVGDHIWRVDYYPNGRDASAKSNSNAVSVYLQLTDGTEHPIQAQYKFSLLDHGGNAAYELPADTGSFTGEDTGEEPAGPGCGHEEFIGRDELERRREDLIVLRCDVGVTQIQSSWLAHDELSEEEESDEQAYYGGYGFPPRGRRERRTRTDDKEYMSSGV